jgi:hypothetical protein
MKKISLIIFICAIFFLYFFNPFKSDAITTQTFSPIPPNDIYASDFEGKSEYIERRLEEKRIEAERLKLEEEKRIDEENRIAEERRLAEEKRIGEEKKRLEEEKRKAAEELALANSPANNSNANKAIYSYMSDASNRISVLERTFKLNDGSYTNSCTYFASEVLRRIGLNLPDSLATTDGLASKLSSIGWKKYTNYKELEKGDIVFSMGPKNLPGRPTHTYIFMGWFNASDYDYGYIVDNQASKYGDIYHKRNIAIYDSYEGDPKEAFQFFMRK